MTTLLVVVLIVVLIELGTNHTTENCGAIGKFYHESGGRSYETSPLGWIYWKIKDFLAGNNDHTTSSQS